MSPEVLQYALLAAAGFCFGYSVYLRSGHTPYVYTGGLLLVLLVATFFMEEV